MSWYESPEVQRHKEGLVDVWHLVGDWTRDLPLEVRRRAALDLEKEIARGLVLDLVDVKFIDSWGEEALCDALQRAHEEGHGVAWVCDASRKHEYEGVSRALQRRSLSVDSFPNCAAAVAAAGRVP